jgi:SAM-dependent methyltransferase
MQEASKTNKVRGELFIQNYLQGRVLDIGAGNDLVCSWAQSFDLQHGDANNIQNHLSKGSFDTVHSSHCIEHMHDPVKALNNWWSLVKPGGFMILVAPDEDLYEQGIWPSFFNPDHKHTFRLDKSTTWSPVSYELRQLCAALPGSQILSADIQSEHYDDRLRFRADTKPRKIRHPIKLVISIVKRIPMLGNKLHHWFESKLVPYGYPFDQTRGLALAQIQIVIKKN